MLKQRSVEPIHVIIGVGATKFAKNSPAKIRMRKQFTSYLPFLMNTETT